MGKENEISIQEELYANNNNKTLQTESEIQWYNWINIIKWNKYYGYGYHFQMRVSHTHTKWPLDYESFNLQLSRMRRKKTREREREKQEKQF